MVWLIIFLIELCSSIFLEVQSHSLEWLLTSPDSLADVLCPVFWSGFYFIVHIIVIFYLNEIWVHLHHNGFYFFVSRCPCRLTMCTIETCCCCLESFQFVSSCYSGNNGPCCLFSMVEVFRIKWLFPFWASYWCLRLRLTRALVFATFTSSATLKEVYQSCFCLCIVITWLSIGDCHLLCILLGFRNGANSSLQEPVTLKELGNRTPLCEVPWFGRSLTTLWTILGSIVTKYYLGYGMFCKYTYHMGNDCIWWGI